MKNWLRNARYNYYFSKALVAFCNPLFKFTKWIAQQIARKIKVNGTTVEYHGYKILFPRSVGVGIASRIYWDGEDGFEPLNSKLLISIFKFADLFVDIGSNFGFYSVLAQKVNKEIRVFAFEPFLPIYRDNARFHSANGAVRQEVYNCALSDVKGEATLHVPDVGRPVSEVSSASLDSSFAFNSNFNREQINVEVSTLDSLFIKWCKGDSQKVVFKIDVEGHECNVLNGAKECINILKPIIVLEIDKTEEKAAQLADLINLLNYQIYAITANGLFVIEEELISKYEHGRDFLLIPKEKSLGSYLPIGKFYEFLAKW